MYKIMVIEDDLSLCALIRESLERYGYKVFIPDSLRDIEGQFKEVEPDLVLLDINLPYYDGFYICRSIRRESRIPVLFISARSGEMDQILGIELGADDYIVKPFSIEILQTKVKSALRRAHGEYSTTGETAAVVKSFAIDERSFKMHYKRKAMELSKTEMKLVKKLFENMDAFVSREELLEEMWDENFIAGDNALTVNVTRIKGKLSSLGIHGAIKTKRGAGYCFDTSVLTGDSNE